MDALLPALAPVFIVILLGWGLRFVKLMPEASWSGIIRLSYFVLAPTYTFTEVAQANLSLANLTFVLTCIASFIVVGTLALGLLPLARGQGPSFASAHQGALRWNAFVVLAISAALLGTEGSGLIALMMGPTIPIVNLFTVLIHARHGMGQNPSPKGILVSLITNPMIIACVLGLAVNLSALPLEGLPADLLSIIGRGALGITLMCVGAGLNLSAIAAKPGLLTASLVLKLLVAPLAFISLGILTDASPVQLACLAIIGAAPSPPAAYTLSREMGGDARLMAGHVTSSTLLSALAIPLALWVAQQIG